MRYDEELNAIIGDDGMILMAQVPTDVGVVIETMRQSLNSYYQLYQDAQCRLAELEAQLAAPCLEEINQALTAIDATWSTGFVPWGTSIICHLTVKGVTRSHVGTKGETEIERYEDALRGAARMFGIGIADEAQPGAG